MILKQPTMEATQEEKEEQVFIEENNTQSSTGSSLDGIIPFTTEEISPRAVLESTSASSSVHSTSSTGSSSNGSSPSSCVEKPSSGIDGSHQWKTLLHLWKGRSMRRLTTFPTFMHSKSGRTNLSRRKGGAAAENAISWEECAFAYTKPSWRSFSYEELVSATDNFNHERLIGKGGHAEVYRGTFPDGQLVAVKKLTKGKTEDQKISDFLSELGIIAHINHPNAAHLIGFGVEGGLHLVLQFSPHGSLASMLHGSKGSLDWSIRYKVAVGTAEGLRYLHEGCQRRIIHRDIKASNILLTEDFEPQISDFGLAKWLPDQWSHHIVSPIEGTFGYLAPEYFMHGRVDEKIDVFAYGVLLLELITGRRALDSCRQSLVMWAKPLLDSRNVKELVDASLRDDYDPVQMNYTMLAASVCIHHLAAMRPRMSQVVRLLKGENMATDSMKRVQSAGKPPPSGRLLLTDGSDADYTSSRYLNDLDRHRELAMEF